MEKNFCLNKKMGRDCHWNLTILNPKDLDQVLFEGEMKSIALCTAKINEILRTDYSIASIFQLKSAKAYKSKKGKVNKQDYILLTKVELTPTPTPKCSPEPESKSKTVSDPLAFGREILSNLQESKPSEN